MFAAAREAPVVFADELLDDGAALHFRGHDFPRVGFHFEMRAEGRVLAEQFEDAEKMIGGVVEQRGGRAVQRDVKMNAPFLVVRGRVREGDIEVAVTGERGAGARDDLVEINVVGEGREGAADFGRGADFERGAEMEFADANAVALQAEDGFAGMLVFDGEMAGVVVHANVVQQALVAGALGGEAVEERDGFLGGLEEAERLGFKTEMQGATGAFGEARDVVEAMPEVAADFGVLFLAVDEFLERAGQRADAALDARGDELGEEVEEEIRVVEAFARGPVRRVNLLLHAAAVEASEGKTIDRENVAALGVEPVAKGGERLRIGEFARGLGAQAEADGVGRLRAHAELHLARETLEGIHGLRPILAPVDVGAVGQMQAVIELHTIRAERGNGGVKGARNASRER